MECCVVCGDKVMKGFHVWNNNQTTAVRFFIRIFLEIGNEFGEFLSTSKLLKWWSTCEQCQRSIEESFTIYKQLEKLVEALQRKQTDFINKLKRADERSNRSNDKSQSPRRQTRGWSKTDGVTQKFRQQLINRDWSRRTILNIPRISEFGECSDGSVVKEEVESDEEDKLDYSALISCYTCKTEQNNEDGPTLDSIQSPESRSDGNESHRCYSAHEDSALNLNKDNIHRAQELASGDNEEGGFQKYSSKESLKAPGSSECTSSTTTTETHNDLDFSENQNGRPGSGKRNQDKGSDDDVSKNDEMSSCSSDDDDDSGQEIYPSPKKRGRKPKSVTTSVQRHLTKRKYAKHQPVLMDFKINPSTNKFHCPSCDIMKTTSRAIKNHYKQVHLKDPSEKAKAYPNLVLPHLPSDPVTNNFNCPDCDYSASSRYRVRSHYKRKHLNIIQKYVCTWPDCGRTFTCHGNWSGHMDKHKGTPRHKCSECPLAFYTRHPLVRHRQIVHEGGREHKNFVCEQCGQAFSNRDYLLSHKSLKHTRKEKEVVCDICGMKQKNIYSHKATVHGIVEKATVSNSISVVCDLCGKQIQKQSLKFHMRNVHQDSSYSANHKWTCSECPSIFTNQSRLDVHLYTKHKIGVPISFTPEFKFQCDVVGCRAGFQIEDQFKSHMEKIHGPDKNKPGPFECKFCGKRFFIKIKLKNHEEIHENSGKQFPCEICGKSFPVERYLRYHLVHTHKMKVENRQGKRMA